MSERQITVGMETEGLNHKGNIKMRKRMLHLLEESPINVNLSSLCLYEELLSESADEPTHPHKNTHRARRRGERLRITYKDFWCCVERFYLKK